MGLRGQRLGAACESMKLEMPRMGDATHWVLRTAMLEGRSLVLPPILPHWTNRWACLLGGIFSLHRRRDSRVSLRHALGLLTSVQHRHKETAERTGDCQNENVPVHRSQGTPCGAKAEESSGEQPCEVVSWHKIMGISI